MRAAERDARSRPRRHDRSLPKGDQGHFRRVCALGTIRPNKYRSPVGRPHWGRSTNIMTTLMAERTLPTFEDFYRSHWHGAQRLATCVAGSAAAGEDIAQEVFQRMYRSWGHAEEPAAYLRV